MILGGRFDHEHVEEEDRTIERQALRQTCKQKAVAEPCDNHQVGEQGNSASTLLNTSNWPRKSCENIGANVTPKLSEMHHFYMRKCMISANEIFEK